MHSLITRLLICEKWLGYSEWVSVVEKQNEGEMKKLKMMYKYWLSIDHIAVYWNACESENVYQLFSFLQRWILINILIR